MMNTYLIGADPEVFVYNTFTNKVISVEGMIFNGVEGSKQKPLKVEEGFYLQEDNVLAEYNIPPANSKQQWISNHLFMLECLNVILPDNCVYKILSSAELDESELQTQQSQIVGCAQDLSVWMEDELEHSFTSNLRCAGGHIHCSVEDIDDLPRIEKAIKAMDMFLGVPSIILDADKKRRSIYGQPGSFRFKPFGFEYRTLSNFWLANETLMGWVYDQTQIALNYKGEITNEVYHIIESQDVNKALEFCNNHGINIPLVKSKNLITQF